MILERQVKYNQHRQEKLTSASFLRRQCWVKVTSIAFTWVKTASRVRFSVLSLCQRKLFETCSIVLLHYGHSRWFFAFARAERVLHMLSLLNLPKSEYIYYNVIYLSGDTADAERAENDGQIAWMLSCCFKLFWINNDCPEQIRVFITNRLQLKYRRPDFRLYPYFLFIFPVSSKLKRSSKNLQVNEWSFQGIA